MVRHLIQVTGLGFVCSCGDRYDATRTSLSGFDISWKAGKVGDTKHWRWGTGGDIRTRGLELNDLGFQNASDHTIPYVFLNYTEQDPGYRYYCTNPAGYYPAVANCPTGWLKVVPGPAAPPAYQPRQ